MTPRPSLPPSSANLDLRFSEVPGATAYDIYGGTLQALHTGLYNHASIAGLCGLTDAVGGDGQVTATVSTASVPSGSYLLAVAVNGAGTYTSAPYTPTVAGTFRTIASYSGNASNVPVTTTNCSTGFSVAVLVIT